MRSLATRLSDLLHSFPRTTVLGVGDLILDQYRRGQAVGLSPEAPAIDLLNPGLVETPGGAANVAWNIGHLGGRVLMVGVVGQDEEARALQTLLERTPGVTLLPVIDPSRPTTLKLRYYHEKFQILRVNQESREPLEEKVAAACRECILARAKECQALFVEDYGKGLVGPGMVETLLELRRTRPDLPVVLDPKVGNHAVYRPGMCSLLKPNWGEACALAGEHHERARPEVVARILSETYGCEVLITLGPKGIYFLGAGQALFLPTRERETFDVAGAGDTTLAALSLCLAAGASPVEAALLANLAGGIVVEKSGTAYVTPEEIMAELQHPRTQEILSRVAQVASRG